MSESLDNPEVVNIFRRERIDGNALFDLEESELEKYRVVIPLGDWKKLLKLIKNVKESSEKKNHERQAQDEFIHRSNVDITSCVQETQSSSQDGPIVAEETLKKYSPAEFEHFKEAEPHLSLRLSSAQIEGLSPCSIDGTLQSNHVSINSSETSMKQPISSNKTVIKSNVGNDKPLCNKRELKCENLRAFNQETNRYVRYRQNSFINLQCSLDIQNSYYHKYVLISSLAKHELENMLLFIRETFSFICACLNEKRKGTIHIGIAGENANVTKQGQIVGVLLNQDQSFYIKYFYDAIDKYFMADQIKKVRQCLKTPQFIEVIPCKGITVDKATKYVIEIDVEPSAYLCQSDVFWVRKPYSSNNKIIVEQAIPYGFKGDVVIPLTDGVQQNQVVTVRQDLGLEATCDESECKNLEKKLVNLFCRGGNEMIGEWYPVLVLNKLKKELSVDEFKRQFAFLNVIKWKAVLDYDNDFKICQLVQDHYSTKIMIIDSCKAFDPSNYEKPNIFSEFQEELQSPANLPWVFVNGYQRDTFKLKDWKKFQRNGYLNMINYFKSVIPLHRATFIFVVMSDEIEIFVEGMEEIMLSFNNQWFCITENNSVASRVKEVLLQRQCIESEILDELIVGGVEWDFVQDIVSKLADDSSNSRSKLLPTTSGTMVAMSEKELSSLTDLEVLSSSECEKEKITKRDKELREHLDRTEKEFYRGGPVSWWNLWAESHVLRRDIYSELCQVVNQSINNSSQESFVGQVFLFHQPGAGGTTLAKQILWNFRKSHRCAIIHNISKDTCAQILKFRSFQNPVKANPVLLLVDNIAQYDNLVSELEDHVKKFSYDALHGKPICSILFCVRRSSIPKIKECKGEFCLKHELSEREKLWFETRQDDLARNFQKIKSVDPTLLISFNVFKSNFDKNIMTVMVKSVLESMKTRCDNNENQYIREIKLLKYISLLNTYDADFTKLKASIFDPIMKDLHVGQRHCAFMFKNNWETTLSQEFCILVNECSSKFSGDLRIAHPFLSKIILDLLCEIDGPCGISELVLELMNCESLFGTTRKQQDDLHNVLKQILIHREKLENGSLEKFSSMILYIKNNEGVDIAAKILRRGFEILVDAFVAQQLARFYIDTKNWDLATQYAETATHLNCTSSYFWDTYGRVYFQQVYEKYDNYRIRIPKDDMITIILLVKQAVDSFRKAQDCSDYEHQSRDKNHAGYCGEIEIVIMLYDLLKRCEIFDSDKDFFNFLRSDVKKQHQLIKLLDSNGYNLLVMVRSLLLDANKALCTLEDELTHFYEESSDDYNNKIGNICRYKEKIDMYLGENMDVVPRHLPEEAQCLYRRKRVFRLAGKTWMRFLRVGCKELELIRELMEINLKSKYVNGEDYLGMIFTNLCLLMHNDSFLTKIKFADMADWSQKLYEKKREMPNSLEPYLFYCLFNWQRSCTTRSTSETNLRRCIEEWKEAFYEKYPRQKADGKPCKKRESVVFYFSNGSDMASIISNEELKALYNYLPLSTNDEKFLNQPSIISILQRFTGNLCKEGDEIELDLKPATKNQTSITIPTGTAPRRNMCNKKVNCVIGFTWSGPKAYDIRLIDPTTDVNKLSFQNESSAKRKYNRFLHLQRQNSTEISSHEDERRIAEIEEKLKLIESVKAKKLAGNILTSEDVSSLLPNCLLH